ncbi:LacI family DNA-binding transcriptional regulator [Occultella gossypii]|uniref:LacI family DNA-binding transcriptional regulator n=1 Tax=Occultella gossypii TaxID=2800820 RepID=A0ABS7SHW7_9MICO|nr:LacI family DNA-binding transcriptional regulator [Occultella gossypii]MBZ2199375.1 LacI family DNA-binding transcriptional regulator [Occultella gossypii]
MAPDIDDVARTAGVSTATVSRALRGLPNVRESTRARVRQVAIELGYAPSASAASLASGRTRTVGLLTPWFRRWFHAAVTEGAERALRADGFDALLYSFELDEEFRRSRVDPFVLRRRVDGVLVVGMTLDADEITTLAGLEVPLVFVGAGPPDRVTVGIDDEAAARVATRHLLDLGHTRIGYLGGAPAERAPWSPPVRRLDGYRSELARAGVEVRPQWLVHGHFGMTGGRTACEALLDAHPEITAVFAASDEMAFGAMQAIRDRGLRVPEDISVIGIDGHDLADLVGLTTVAQDAVEQGAAAAALVLEMLTGTPVGDRLTYPTTLVERSSTAIPPI